MNILFVIPSFHTNLYYALKALRAAGHRVDLVCAGGHEGVEKLASTHTVIDQATLTYRDAAALMNRLAPDFVVIRKTGRFSKIVHRVAMQQRRHVIGYDQRPYLRPRHVGQVVHGVLNGRPMRRFTPVHGLPGSGRPDPRASYIPFPVDPMPPEAQRSYAPDGIVRILCVAKLTECRKNHFLLLKALEPLAEQFSFQVTLVGSSSLDIGNPDRDYFEALQNYALNGPLADRMTIKPDVSFSDMTAIYRSHDVCVLPSRAEPLGTAPLEAMAQGCAAVISSDAGSAYYVKGGEEVGLPCGGVFPSEDSDALSRTIAEMIADPETVQGLGQNAAEWTRREFSPELFAKRFGQLPMGLPQHQTELHHSSASPD